MAEQRGVIAAAGPLIAFSRIGTLRSVTMDMAHWPPGFENSSKNVTYRASEKMGGEKPIDLVRAIAASALPWSMASSTSAFRMKIPTSSITRRNF